jgi:soluble cytochrome b562
VEKELNQACIRRDVEKARNFVLELEKLIETVTTDRIEEVRAHMKTLKRSL